MKEDCGQKHLCVRATCAVVDLGAPGAVARAAMCLVGPEVSHGQTFLVITDYKSLVCPGRICF